MEIDFLGLSSPNFRTQQLNPNNIASSDTASAGVETSLSLSTTTSFDYCQRENLKFSEKKKKKKKIWEFGIGDKMMTSSSSGSSISSTQSSLVLDSIPVVATAGFLFDLNDKSTTLRNVSEIRADQPASLSIIYSGQALVFNDTSPPEKAEGTTYIAGKQSRNHARTCTRDGHTTTVAMARRATLARFLEKRLHRMNQARNCHLMGKSQNAINSEACSDTVSTGSNKRRNNSLTRS